MTLMETETDPIPATYTYCSEHSYSLITSLSKLIVYIFTQLHPKTKIAFLQNYVNLGRQLPEFQLNYMLNWSLRFSNLCPVKSTVSYLTRRYAGSHWLK